MKTLFIICLLIISSVQFNTLHCQNRDALLIYKFQYDSLYGLDPDLYNGIKYFPEHSLARGFPFWKDDKAMMANIVLSGKYYKELKIRYNLYTQEFILEYSDQFDGMQRLVINRLKIDSVFMNNCLFVKNKYDDIKSYFIQVIHEDKISCYFSLKKEYLFSNSGVQVGHEYSNELINSYIVKEGIVYPFSNKGSFLKIFAAYNQNLIRKYMKDNRIKVKRKIPSEMMMLCIFCNKLEAE